VKGMLSWFIVLLSILGYFAIGLAIAIVVKVYMIRYNVTFIKGHTQYKETADWSKGDTIVVLIWPFIVIAGLASWLVGTLTKPKQ
jgi:hypothetical protein